MDSVVSLRRAMLCLVCLLLVKVCEYLVLEPRLEQLAEKHSLPIMAPKVSHPRCDACRSMALMFDGLFREEDSKIEHLGLELSQTEVADIVNMVCSKDVFRKAMLVEVEGYQRLSLPNLETWSLNPRPSLAQPGVDWPQRVATHCRYMADKMPGLEIYDLWLRTGWGDPLDWVEFLCEGEGVFGDCNTGAQLQHWPGELTVTTNQIDL